ncbi:hypothetical protein RM531_10075 [Salinisphaera sp. P385]|uniref:Uncharacterized protein n=1 Tax=Spectribacter acetivorans TaxID=3075603 RepID=A0ABU3B8M1_9GAMM|nr:hypothetical protein [Salinisphaera sp. P385]MDT0618820.1 hypothetical protein [Salinisphaera sp. P385]
MKTELIAGLFNWAVLLSGYADPGAQPALEFREHSFFVENACQGQECRVMGWYNDADVVYLDTRLEDLESTFARSLLVHEFVHYLQHHSGELEDYSCAQQISREREAYSIQRQYMAEVHGEAYFHMMRPALCRDESGDSPAGPN